MSISKKSPKKAPNPTPESTKVAPKLDDPPKNILLVGDWVLDEDWVVGPMRSVTSSRVGKSHDRALQDIDNSVKSLGGAARTTSLLYRCLKQGKSNAFHITALGLWHPTHKDFLRQLLNPVNREKMTPLRQGSIIQKEVLENDIRMVNLGEYLTTTKNKIDDAPGTTRIIRVYNRKSGKIEIRQRIDWISHSNRMERNHEAWITNMNDFESSKLDDDISSSIDEQEKKKGQQIVYDAVVIKDMGHGVISTVLLDWLRKSPCVAGAKWYISSKYWITDRYGDVFSLIPNIELLVIPEIAARSKILDESIGRWTIKKGIPTNDAISVIDDLRINLRKNSPQLKVLVQPDRTHLFAIDYTGPDWRLYAHCETDGNLTNQPVPMASILFAYLSADLLKSKGTFVDFLKKSLIYTKKVMALEFKKLADFKSWSPKLEEEYEVDPNKDVQQKFSNNAEFYANWNIKNVFPNLGDESLDVKKEWVRWKYALREQGVIGKSYLPLTTTVHEGVVGHLELWRSMTEVDGYVCCLPERQKEIRRLVREIHSFVTQKESGEENARNVSCMVVGKPGDGKTFLVSQIAKMFKMRLVPFNITQMSSKADIFDSFLSIATEQAQSNGEPILVFVDEINAKLDGQHVYDAFLSPLEDGVYIHGSKQLKLAPCAWIFCGTETPKDSTSLYHSNSDGTNHSDHSEKASDFMSRLSLRKPCSLTTSEDKQCLFEEILRNENVYLGVSIIRHEYSDVDYISEKVLRAFYALPTDLGIRDLKYFVRSFKDIRYGTVNSHHLPKRENWLDIMNLYPDSSDVKRKVAEAMIDKYWDKGSKDDVLVHIFG